MYLKSIEIHGFKSFANKIVFKFHNGITGIVGPNGSGKSNVADAVRWVLGEQRIKQLRGASMQDVIFSGTETRKPLSYAYVAITLDNSDHQLAIDYDEVTVARRIYRSGESEYSINGSLVRLKDVTELFYDTGIGKEGYSIIGQGQIDKILSGKPEERRELFDEAVGIVKFKRRKETAQKKLENEKQNLVRVNDILAELEKQVGPLEKQSEKAKIYLKKKQELETLDVNMFLVENKHINDELASTSEKLSIAENDYKETTESFEKTKTEYEEIQGQLTMLEEAIEKARQELSNTDLMREKLEGEIKILKEKINSAKGNEEHFITRKDSITAEIMARENEKNVTLEDKKATDDLVASTERERAEAAALLSEVQSKIEDFNARIEAGKNVIIQALGERASIKSRMERQDTILEQCNIQKAELNSRLLRAKSDEAEQKDNLEKLREAFTSVTEEIGKLNEKRVSIEEKLGLIKEEMTAKDQKLRDMQVDYHREKSKLEALSNLTERYEGYGGSVKKVMEQKDTEKGIIGVVADIVKVEKKYEVAIETALGGNIQNIVTEDEATAKHMIAYLKQTKGGRATFLPLTSITNPQEFKTPEALDEEGVLGLADSLVKTDKKYVNVAKAMVGRIMVVDTVDHALKIARKYDYGIRMVTLEGELLVPGGAISGGTFKNNSNLLGRRREMDELESKVKQFLKDIDDMLSDIEKTKEERNSLRIELEKTKAAIQERSIAQNTARLNVISAEEKWNETEEGYGNLQDEQADIERRIKEASEEKEEILAQLAESEALEKTTEGEIVEFQSELEVHKGEETDKLKRVSEWDVELEKYRQQQAFKQQNIDRIDGEIGRLQSELSEIEQGITAGEEDIAAKEHDITEIEKTILQSHTTKSDTEEKLQGDIKQKEELSERQKTFFERREELATRQTDLDKEVYRLQAQKERLEGAIEAKINYMWDEYEITLSDAAAMRDESMTDLPSMKKEIASLKDQIRKLGDVNVNAIEDYKNLMERYTFLKEQHDDLVQAEETLRGIIAELDSAMRKQFDENFAKIKQEFDKVFKELFGGGKGTVELMEDEDILEAGIRIIAQPPGKKLQNMMQLSGGEKALTAIALLFAIQNLKPSPFCLLDEIEAALDESNVGRFAKYLHKLTKNTQFIVITHRRGTMERADRLYGITMQEKGISTLVSVNLIDDQLSS